jgi:EpsI family protein
MFQRRDVLLGLPLLAAAGGAVALVPRHRLDLRGNRKLADAVPSSFGGWSVVPSNAVVLPKGKERLADRLYSEQVSRLYTSADKLPVMLVIAYGSTQSDLLQLHRPEMCYGASGFEISMSRRVNVRVGDHAVLPMRELTARLPDRVEPILYWTRIGDYLPTTGPEQRLMKLRSEMAGYVADGVLVRFSTVAEPTEATYAILQDFARTMLAAMPRESRAALIGRNFAEAFEPGTGSR